MSFQEDDVLELMAWDGSPPTNNISDIYIIYIIESIHTYGFL